jgi:hypothetical protein
MFFLPGPLNGGSSLTLLHLLAVRQLSLAMT